MATQSLATQIGMKLCHAKAIADLMGACGDADLGTGTMADAGHALCTMLDEVEEMIRRERAPWADFEARKAAEAAP